MSDISKDNLFRRLKSKAESKADITNSAARAIIDEQVQARETKTQRLRAARLKMEAEAAARAPAEKAAKKPRPRKAAAG